MPFSWIYTEKDAYTLFGQLQCWQCSAPFLVLNGESFLPLPIPFLPFSVAYKSFSLTFLKTFFSERYFQLCSFVNFSVPEFHFSTCVYGNWPQSSGISSSPILFPWATLAFGQFVFLIGNKSDMCLSEHLGLVSHCSSSFCFILWTNSKLSATGCWQCWHLQVGRLFVKTLEGWTRAPGDEEMRCLFQTLPDQTVYHPLGVTGMF